MGVCQCVLERGEEGVEIVSWNRAIKKRERQRERERIDKDFPRQLHTLMGTHGYSGKAAATALAPPSFV